MVQTTVISHPGEKKYDYQTANMLISGRSVFQTITGIRRIQYSPRYKYVVFSKIKTTCTGQRNKYSKSWGSIWNHVVFVVNSKKKIDKAAISHKLDFGVWDFVNSWRMRKLAHTWCLYCIFISTLTRFCFRFTEMNTWKKWKGPVIIHIPDWLILWVKFNVLFHFPMGYIRTYRPLYYHKNIQ